MYGKISLPMPLYIMLVYSGVLATKWHKYGEGAQATPRSSFNSVHFWLLFEHKSKLIDSTKLQQQMSLAVLSLMSNSTTRSMHTAEPM